MKFLYLTTNYAPYLKDFYSRRPSLAKASFETQIAALESDAFGCNGGWRLPLEALGYEFREIIANAGPAQRSWMEEHALPWPELTWKASVAAHQVVEFKPEILFIDAPRDFNVAWMQSLRERCPSIRLIVGWSMAPCEDLDVLRHYDVLLSGSRLFIDKYRKEGCRTEYLRCGFNKSVLPYLAQTVQKDEVLVFTGGVVRGKGFHVDRERLIEAAVGSSLPFKLYSAAPGVTPMKDLVTTAAKGATYGLMRTLEALGVSQDARRSLPFIGKAATWTSAPPRQIPQRLWKHMKPAVYGMEMYRALKRSAVSLNSHVDCAGGEAVNLRLYEVTGVGTCLLTDAKSNLSQLFELDREVVAYNSPAECIEKAKWLLDHPSERRSIAAAGQARTLREHTLENRAAELHTFLTRRLAQSKP